MLYHTDGKRQATSKAVGSDTGAAEWGQLGGFRRPVREQLWTSEKKQTGGVG